MAIAIQLHGSGVADEVGALGCGATVTLVVAFSKCVRDHGLPSFPDPTRNLPPPPAPNGFVRGGFYWPVGRGTVSSPGFLRAARACGWHITHPVAGA